MDVWSSSSGFRVQVCDCSYKFVAGIICEEVFSGVRFRVLRKHNVYVAQGLSYFSVACHDIVY